MNRQERFFLHSLEIAGFRLGRPGEAASSNVSDPGAADPGAADPGAADPGAAARAERLIRSARDAGKSSIILFGLDSPEFARLAAQSLDPGMELTVCEPDPERGRALLFSPDSPFSRPDGPAALMCDDSDWAIFCLLRQAGLRPGACLTAMNVAGDDPGRKKRLLGLRRLFTGSGTACVSEEAGEECGERIGDEAPVSCDFGAILHPDEPDLEDFFRSIPAFCKRVVLVWDAVSPPRAAHSPALAGREAIHLARPLAGDFSAQRNLMLSACVSDRVLTLDADERPGPVMRALLPRLCALPVSGFLFPRMTLYPGPDRVKTGFGLWPDPQLRLFTRRGAGYVRPVHERLEGIGASPGLVLWAPIHHLSNLQKDAAALARKHAIFDKAQGGTLRHRQNAVYPSLPLAFFEPGPDAVTGEIAILPGG